MEQANSTSFVQKESIEMNSNFKKVSLFLFGSKKNS